MSNTIAESTLSAATLYDSLASNRTSFKVGPIRCERQYHGRLLTGFVNADHAEHAANILSACDRYDTAVIGDGTTVRVIALKPTS
jgi:hypothetical protein